LLPQHLRPAETIAQPPSKERFFCVVWSQVVTLYVSIFDAELNEAANCVCSSNTGTFVFEGWQPVHPIGVDSDSIAAILYNAGVSTGSAFTGLAGEVASVMRDPAASAKRTKMERVFLFMTATYLLNRREVRLDVINYAIIFCL
jgi:hypothetical protein